MASLKFNKIVRKNNPMKPWKNTSQIVSSCIRKMYESNEVKNDMLPSKEALLKPEGESPNCSARATTPRLKGCTPKKQTTCVAASLEPKVLHGSLVSNHKLLKSPNYKIYGSRRSGSSASSTNGSLFRRYEKQRQNRGLPTNPANFLLHTVGARTINPCNGSLSCIFNSVTLVRNQHINLAPDSAAMGISAAIQQDLMPIDSALKGRIALRGAQNVQEAVEPIKTPKAEPMKGRSHPPSADLSFPRVVKQEAAVVESVQEPEQTSKPKANCRLSNLARPMGHKPLPIANLNESPTIPRLTTECCIASTPAAKKPDPPLATPVELVPKTKKYASTTESAEQEPVDVLDPPSDQCKFPSATAQVVAAVVRTTGTRFSRNPYQFKTY